MSNVTRKDIANQFGVTMDMVEQVGSKQLFIVKVQNSVDKWSYRSINDTILVSYHTIIGVQRDGLWYITDKRYSVTTSKQTTQFCNGRIVKRVDESELQSMLYRE